MIYLSDIASAETYAAWLSWFERNKTRINEIKQERKYIYSTLQLDSCQLPWQSRIIENCAIKPFNTSTLCILAFSVTWHA